MSGQPVKTQADINRKRNEYMETLNLQEQINDMNLTANKNYLLTGQLPPQSQMQDTRTTAEKLKDVEFMKREIASALSSVAEPQVAYQIVNRVIESPLNLNGSLLRFLAQRAPSIAEQFQRNMAFGVEGNVNDIDRIVEFIKNLYSDQQGKFQTTKSYMNSIGSNSGSRVISANDIDSVIQGIDDIVKNIHILIQRQGGENRIAEGRLYTLRNKLYNLKDFLPSTSELQQFINDKDFMMSNKAELTGIFDLLENLPKYTEVVALVGKINQYIKSNNRNLVNQGVQNLFNMFSCIFTDDYDRLSNSFKNNILSQIRNENELMNQNLLSQQQQQIQNQQQINRNMRNAQKVYIVNGQDDPVWIRNNDFDDNMSMHSVSSTPSLNSLAYRNDDDNNSVVSMRSVSSANSTPSMRSVSSVNSTGSLNPFEILPQIEPQEPRTRQRPPHIALNLLQELNKGVNLKHVESGEEESKGENPALKKNKHGIVFSNDKIRQLRELERQEEERMRNAVPNISTSEKDKVSIISMINNLSSSQIDQFEPIFGKIDGGLYKRKSILKDKILGELANDNYTIGQYGIGGLGIKKRRGRPRGSGIVKPVLEKVPNFVGFGINEINQKQLGKGIVKIRRNTKSNYIDMPSRRVSSNLQNILKTITGGGMPKYDELGQLSDEEKDYLHKLLERSDLTSRISVPTPSKDQYEKDIHNFEVMKGQIMSGNDSVELVKKFKLLIRKLAKQDLLPKADVDDLNDLLNDLGY